MVVSWFAVVILRSRSPFMIYWLGIHGSVFRFQTLVWQSNCFFSQSTSFIYKNKNKIKTKPFYSFVILRAWCAAFDFCDKFATLH